MVRFQNHTRQIVKNNILLIVLVIIAFSIGVYFGSTKTTSRNDFSKENKITNDFSVENLKSVGKLVVMQAVLKEITTSEINIDERGYALGSPKKAAYIITFDVEFSYDLRNGPLTVTTSPDNDGNKTATVEMPPVDIVYHIKDLQVYDEKKGTWWGIPQEISVGEKNELIQKAKQNAFRQAKGFITSYKYQYENSASITLKLLAEAFNVNLPSTNIKYQKTSKEILGNQL